MKHTKIVSLVVVVTIGLLFSLNLTRKDSTLRVGAILPLSGPASIWGENVQKGITLALQDKKDMEVLYEDSKGKPADGLSAYKSLKTKDPHIMLSILSAVTVPLSETTDEDKTPLFATLTAADGVANPHTVRYYSNADNFASPSFTDSNSPLQQAKKIAVLYRNDDLGKSVYAHIVENAKSKGITITIAESFNPSETDFNTAITKIKSSGSEALVFVPVTPGEATGILKTAQTLSLNIPLVEASNVFADIGTRKSVSDIPFFSNIYTFSKSNDSYVLDFKKRYEVMYGGEPNFAVAFGYDAINLIYSCRDKKEEILNCIKSSKTTSGVTGVATQIADGDFNVPMIFDSVQ